MFSRLCFCAVFCVFLNRWEQWKPLKTLRRAVKTASAENQKKSVQGQVWDGFWSHFWGPVGDKCDFFVEKMSAKKQAEKRYPRKVKRVETVMSQGSLTAPLKSKIVWVINNNWTRSNNNKQQFNKNTNNCRVVASARLLLCVFLVRFLLQTDVVSVSCSILNVVAELVIWHALSKARRIRYNIWLYCVFLPPGKHLYLSFQNPLHVGRRSRPTCSRFSWLFYRCFPGGPK